MGQGYTTWSIRVLLDQPYFDGRWYNTLHESDPGSNSRTPTTGNFILDVHDGGTLLQVPYRGAKAPNAGMFQTFDMVFLADDEDDYAAYMLSKARCAPVLFIPGWWEMDVFSGAVAGQSYTLMRPTAAGAGPSATPDGMPLTAANCIRIYLNGVRDDPSTYPTGSAVVSGQNVLANASGEIAIYYMAAYWVAFNSASDDWKEVNDLLTTFELQEITQGNFG